MTTMVNYSLMVALFLAWVGLFAVKDASREAGTRVALLQQQIEDQQTAVHALRTDWAILNEPSYLQDLAQTHLALGTMHPQQIVTMAALPPVPLHDRTAPNGGMVFASAPVGSTYSTTRLGTFMQTRVSARDVITPDPYANDPYANMSHPVLRPDFLPMRTGG